MAARLDDASMFDHLGFLLVAERVEQPDDFGQRLRDARIREGLTQKELANRAGVSQPAIAKWEQGRTSPRSESRARLEAVIGVGEEP
jgi:ribosome-binding protein aMBF1 (putative translation factor)